MWKTIQDEGRFLGLTCIAVPDLGAGAIEIMSSITGNCCIVGLLAEEFEEGALLTEIVMLAELGLLTPTGSRYQMTIPTRQPDIDDVRAAASKLPEPNDEGNSYERFITAMSGLEANQWQRRLSVMDENHRCADQNALLGVTLGDIHIDRSLGRPLNRGKLAMPTLRGIEPTIEEWLAIRKEAGLRIDPATAEITWCWGQVMDPYGVENLPKECWQVGRNRFARSPGGGVWVSFHDLPEATVAALWKRIDAGDHDDDWLEAFPASG
jgi:hypothetical protein